ncbi:MAG: transketolase C-terminal domain-containing protein [Candidatus Micrarchaeota archaeon]
MTTTNSMHLIENLLEPKVSVRISEGFGKGLVELGEKDPNVWGLSADVTESTRMHYFAEKFPERFVQVGVAEQNMAGVAAGIAACGKTAFISAYGVFSPGRNWDQIRVSICYNDVPVIIHASHTGVTVGPDGASHQALEDVASVRPIPNLIIEAPCDMEQAKKAVFALAKTKKPGYLRTSRETAPVFTTDKTPFVIGKANVYRDGKDIAIFACGMVVYESLKAAMQLEKEGISCAVIDMHTIKPIDEDCILKYAKKCKVLMSVEDHQVIGGLGGAISEVLCENSPALLHRHGIYNRFCESGGGKELMHKYELDAEGIVKQAKKALKMK